MRSVIVSNYALVREGLYSILSKFDNMKINLVAETMGEVALPIRKNEIDMVFLDLHQYNSEELAFIKEMKEHGVRSKFVIIDFNNNKELFVKAIKCGVEGYILGKSNESEILHITGQIYSGKKYFDSYFIDSMINDDDPEPDGLEQLTAREREILCEIGRGMSNRMISEKFCISEHTVKKHINHIFDKLNIRDRTQAALFANNCGILSRDVC